MEENGWGGKAGHSRRCEVGETYWHGEGPGKALVTIDEEQWVSYDYKEEIFMTEELSGLMGVLEPEKERRQCVTKVLAAGCLHAQHGELPDFDMVENMGQQFRLEQARQAAEAEGIMGHSENKVAAVEYELRHLESPS